MLADLSATTVLLIAAPVAVALFLLVLVLYASARSRSPVASHLEREAARRDRARVRAELERVEEKIEEPAMVEAGPLLQEEQVPGTGLAVPEEAHAPATQSVALEEARRARLVAPPVPTRDPEHTELDRRQFINRGLVGGVTLGLGIFGASALAFAYPKAGGGFGGKVNARTTPEDAKTYFETNKKPYYSGEGRFYIVPFRYQDEAATKAIYSITFDPSKAAGVMVLYQKCAHLGCRVPWCDASEWFECPCHGSKYNSMGEWQGGPAPRGLSRFKFTVSPQGEMVVDTGTPLDAPARGPNSPGLPTPANHCVA